MSPRKIIFVNGQFYDAETRKRVTFRNGADLWVDCGGQDISFGVDAGHKPTVKSKRKQESELYSNLSRGRYEWYQPLLGRGGHLYFSINLQLRESYWTGDFKFKVLLLEDLYAYKLLKSKADDIRLADCACVMEEVITGDIEYFTKVHGKSLNEVYKTTYVHYFSNFGSPTANAHDRFFTDPLLTEGSVIRNLYSDETKRIKLVRID